MSYVDRAQRPWYEAYGHMRGRWWLLVCTWDIDKLMRTMYRIAKEEDNPVRQAKQLQMQFYKKPWFREHNAWRT
jgi:hypothetical protein